MKWTAVGVGAALGAWLRWGLSLWLNPIHHILPLGTLAANWGGGYLIGFAVSAIQANPAIPVEWRLFAITGFLGGLTTFSSFSAEAMTLLQRGEYGWAFFHSAVHLIGSIAFCMAGFASYKALAN